MCCEYFKVFSKYPVKAVSGFNNMKLRLPVSKPKLDSSSKSCGSYQNWIVFYTIKNTSILLFVTAKFRFRFAGTKLEDYLRRLISSSKNHIFFQIVSSSLNGVVTGSNNNIILRIYII